MTNETKAATFQAPWTLDYGDWMLPLNDDHCYRVLNAEGEIAAQCTEEDEARLTTAAPDLLHALEALMRQTNNIEVLGEWAAEDRNHRTAAKVRAEVDEVKALARAAIAKALGSPL